MPRVTARSLRERVFSLLRASVNESPGHEARGNDLALSRHKDQLSRILRSVRALIETRVQMLHLKSRADEQVLGLESKQVSQSKGLDQALLTAIRMSDVIDQLVLIDLVESIPRNCLVTAED